MNKNIIKMHLSNFLNEDKKPVGLTQTEKVQKESGKFNKDNEKAVAKEVENYDDAIGGKENADSVKKYENNKSQEEYHDDYEILNGQEMLKYDNEPNDKFKERAIKAIEGDASMGNSSDYANVVPKSQGFSGPTFGKDLVKRVKSRVKKQDDAMQYDGMGDVAIPRGKNKTNKSVAVAESTENKLQVKTNKMKRLKFKNAFNGVGNALQLIPEAYKVDNKTFQMTDGNENYEIRWEGTLNEGKAVILKAEDKTMISENMAHMKHLMGYKSQDTLGAVKGTARLNENSAFADVFAKTKALLEGKVAKDIIVENATGVAGMGFEASDKPNPSEVKPGTESGHAKAEGPMVMAEDEEEELNEYGNPMATDRGLEFSDNNVAIKMFRNLIQNAPEMIEKFQAMLADAGSAAGQAIRREEFGGAGDGITDNNAAIKMFSNLIQQAPEMIGKFQAMLANAGSAAGQAIRREDVDRFDEVFDSLNEDEDETEDLN